MTLYISCYDRGWKIATVESELLRVLGRAKPNKEDTLYTRYKPGMGHYGPIYHGGQLYTTMDAARIGCTLEHYKAHKFLWEGEKEA